MRDATRARRARLAFHEQFGAEPEAVAFAPGRVGLIGDHGGCSGGSALQIAIDLGTTCAAASRADGRVAVRSRQVGGPAAVVEPDDFDGSGPAGWLGAVVGCVVVAREHGWLDGGVSLVVDADLPLGAGLSSSASLVAAVLAALVALSGGRVAPIDLARAAHQVEYEWTSLPGSMLDHVVASLAEPGAALLAGGRTEGIHPVPLNLDAQGLEILLIDTTIRSYATAGPRAQRRAACREAAQLLGVESLAELSAHDLDLVASLPEPIARRARHVVTEQARVMHAVHAFADQDLVELGIAFAGSHDSLRRDFEVSCPALDLTVGSSVMAGAAAARMTGGGFGGHAVVLCDGGDTRRIKSSVRDALAFAGQPVPRFRTVAPAGGARALV